MTQDLPVPNDFVSDFFLFLETLDAPSRAEIERAATRKTFASREFVYAQGTAGSSIYIIDSGVVEAVTFSGDGTQSRVVAVMTRGDFFGDLAILTGHPRLAGVRVRETAELLCLEKAAFLELMKKIPALGLFFSHNLAYRLYSTSVEAHHSVYAIDLTGNLQRFDLLTIVQAITNMGHTGELHLHNSGNELLGSFFFRHGQIEHARFGHLSGLEAIWQGFIESAFEGTFTFRKVENPTLPFPTDNKIKLDSTYLLLEGVGKRDIYQGMPESLRMMEGRLARTTDSLTWSADETRDLAEQIWNLIADKPQPLVTLWRGLNYSAISFLEVVMEMGLKKQAELNDDASDPEK